MSLSVIKVLSSISHFSFVISHLKYLSHLIKYHHYEHHYISPSLHSPWSVDGTMIINGGTFCRTIEHPKNYLLANSYKIVLVPVKIENGTEEFKTLPVIFGADDRVPPKVVQKPFITPGLGPFRLKYGSIIIGKPLITGLMTYSEEYFQEFLERVNVALKNKEKVSLLIRDWGSEDIPQEDPSPSEESQTFSEASLPFSEASQPLSEASVNPESVQ